MGVEELHEAGNDAFRAGRHNSAVRRYSRALQLVAKQKKKSPKEKVPAEADLLMNRAACYLALKMNFDSALADATAAAKLRPKSAKAHYRVAQCQVALGEHEAAVKSCATAVGLVDGEAPAELTALDAEAKRQGGLNPDGSKFSPAMAARQEGNAHFKGGRIDEAIASYTEALDKLTDEDDPIPIYNNRALCYQQLYSYKKVIADCTSVLELDPKNVKALVKRAQARQALEKYEEALEDVRAALAVDGTIQQARQLQHQLQQAIRAGKDIMS